MRDVLLAADGGGIRGIIIATMVLEIEKLLGTPLLEKVDFMAGASTGAIFLAALTQQSARECLFLYLKLAGEVFPKSRLPSLKPYNQTPLEEQLRKTFGESKVLNELGGPKFIISAASTKRDPPGQIVFRNYDVPNLNSMGCSETISFDPAKTHIWAAMRCSSAAPMYFPPVDYPHPALHCNSPNLDEIEISDGGLCDNNPSDLLLEEYSEATKGSEHRVSCFISMGTGKVTRQTDGINFMGLRSLFSNPLRFFHLKNLVDLLVNKVCESESRVAAIRQRVQGLHPGGQYFRFQPTLDEPTDLNETDPRKLVRLVWTAKMYMMSAEVRQKMLLLVQTLSQRSTNDRPE